jgi:acetyl esterase/lipase
VTAGLFFTYALVAFLATVNALRKPVPPTSRLPPLWLPAMITSELAPAFFALRLAIALLAIWLGVPANPVGRAGLVLLVLAQFGLLWVMVRSWLAVRTALRGIDAKLPAAKGRERWFGRPISLPPDVELLHHLEYHDELTLDLYRERGHAGRPSPTLVYIHGGAWTGGGPHRQARPLFHHLAQRGWIVATIRYPLSPHATHPDHLVAVKRALAWCKSAGATYAIDPDRIAVAGGSAGGHLASLAALTANRPEFQPGFEHVDTEVAACVPMYGIYDFFNRHDTRWNWPVIPRAVMKTTPEQSPDAYRSASPMDQVGDHAPPFLVVHGAHDSLVPPPEARHFVDALKHVSSSVVELFEVPGGQHAFDAISSPRTRAVVARITHFLEDTVLNNNAENRRP